MENIEKKEEIVKKSENIEKKEEIGKKIENIEKKEEIVKKSENIDKKEEIVKNKKENEIIPKKENNEKTNKNEEIQKKEIIENLRKGENKENIDKKEEIEDIHIEKNKEEIKNIVSSLPKRTNTTFQSLKAKMKSLTQNLSAKEKSYVVFLWVSQNIIYDTEGYFSGRKVDCSPEGVFKNGKTVCSGYADLYKDLAINLGLIVECVSCYSKGYGYEPGQKLTRTNHEYNVIKLNNKWFPIDSTWGSGHLEENTYIKEINEFYFLANPELLITSHFPKDEKWLLTQKKYTLQEFLYWPKIYSSFFQYDFYKYSPENGLIELKNQNTYKFIVWRKKMKNVEADANIYLLSGNCYYQQLKLNYNNYYDDRFEVDCIFNKKGQYKIELFGNDTGDSKTSGIIDYIVKVENDAKKEIYFPRTYYKAKNIYLIEPLYDNLKSGGKVKFKIKSDLDTIIIIDKEWNYLEKNDNGFFEKEITIQTSPGDNVVIGYKNDNGNCGSMVSYNVV